MRRPEEGTAGRCARLPESWNFEDFCGTKWRVRRPEVWDKLKPGQLVVPTPKEEPLIVLAKPPETDLNPTGESFQYADDPGETEIHSDVWAITTPDKT